MVMIENFRNYFPSIGKKEENKVYNKTNGNRITNGKYSQEQGVIKIYVPDGHLQNDKRDGIGGIDVWDYTGIGYPIERNAKLELDRYQLRNKGYKDSNVEKLVLVRRRPHDIPKSVLGEGAGISGADFISDELQIPVVNGDKDSEFYKNELEKQGIRLLMDLRFKPVSLYYAFPTDLDIREYSDIKNYSDNYIGRKDCIIVASEYSYLAKRGLEKLAKIPSNRIKIISIRGGAEGYPVSYESHGILDVVETGNSLLDNNLRPVFPELLNTTPHLVTNIKTQEFFPDFISEFKSRLKEGVDDIESKYPEFFKYKFDPSTFD